MHLTNDRSNAFPQLYARVCKAITGEHCKALFKGAETTSCSELDGNKLTIMDLHWNKRKGSWEKVRDNELILRPVVEYDSFLCVSAQVVQTVDISLVAFLKWSRPQKQWIMGFSKHLIQYLESKMVTTMAGLSLAHGTKLLFYMGAFSEDLWGGKFAYKFFSIL